MGFYNVIRICISHFKSLLKTYSVRRTENLTTETLDYTKGKDEGLHLCINPRFK